MASPISPAHTLAVRMDTDAMQAGRATVIIPQFAAISFSTSGDNTIVAAANGKQIRVLGYNFVVAGATVVTWKSSVAGAISGPKSLGANGLIVVDGFPVGIIQTAVGEGLVLNSSNAVSVGGELTYILV